MDLAFILTCYRCRSEFLHPSRWPAYCMHWQQTASSDVKTAMDTAIPVPLLSVA